MSLLINYFGQPSYVLENGVVNARVSVLGGRLTAGFQINGKFIDPFFMAPWWREDRLEGVDEVVQGLRGSFFCFPFGNHAEPCEGKSHPLHGRTANECWEFRECKVSGFDKKLVLEMHLDDALASVEGHYMISELEPVIYQRNVVKNFQGRAPVAYHPTLQLPDKIGSVIMDVSKPLTAFVSPHPMERPENRGYSILKSGMELSDLTNVSCVDGNSIDLTRQPIVCGYEDAVILINDEHMDFTYTALTFISEGFVYFQIKDPKVLKGTMLWMSNGGRHYPPWNGRIHSVLGVEDCTSFFHYGVKASIENNFLQQKGHKTFVNFNKAEPVSFNLIFGMVPVPRGFEGIVNIKKKNESTITLYGRRGETLDVPCRLDWMFQS